MKRTKGFFENTSQFGNIIQKKQKYPNVYVIIYHIINDTQKAHILKTFAST